MIAKVSRNLYNSYLALPQYRRALAFAILIKSRHPASVIPHWSYRELARISGKSVGFCKKAVGLLREMHLIREERYGNRPYLVFKKLREPKKKNRHSPGFHTPRHKDIDISRLDCSSLVSIERGLCSLLIVEIQKRKDWVYQLISTKQCPANAKDYSKAKAVCRKRGYEGFSESGLSYLCISRKLKCGRSTVTKVIAEGESRGLFQKTKHPARIWDGDAPHPYFSKCGDLFYQPANTYSLQPQGDVLYFSPENEQCA